MTRLILSILAGILANFILATGTDIVLHETGIYPPYGEPMFDTGLLVLASAYRAVFQIFSGYLTALLAREQAKKAIWILGITGAVLWIIGTITMSGYGPAWYGIMGAVLAIPTTLIGGKLYELRVRQLR